MIQKMNTFNLNALKPFSALDAKNQRNDQRTTLAGLLSWLFSAVSGGMSTKLTSELMMKPRRRQRRPRKLRKQKVIWEQQHWPEVEQNSLMHHHDMNHGRIMPNHCRPRASHHDHKLIDFSRSPSRLFNVNKKLFFLFFDQEIEIITIC